jgi:chitinase
LNRNHKMFELIISNIVFSLTEKGWVTFDITKTANPDSMKKLFTALMISLSLQASAQTLTIYVKAGTTPLQGVTVNYTCDWNANLGAWTTYNSGTTDVSGKIITTKGMNLSNVVVTVGNIPWAVSQQYGSTVYPTSFNLNPLLADTSLEFNTQQNNPVVSITKPAASTLSIAYGAACDLAANASIASGASISSVKFEVAGLTIPGILSSGTSYVPQSAWVPLPADYYKTQTLKVTATSSAGTSATATYSFYLGCASNCPDKLPIVSLSAPTNLTISQVGGFAPVTISANATDPDGTISSVKININGSSFPMSLTASNNYSYTFTPTAYISYPFSISATDNSASIGTYSNTIVISNSSFTPLPKHVVVGYWQAWNNTSAPFMYMKSLIGTKFNVVNYSFIETNLSDGYTPILTTYDNAYLTNGTFDPALLKQDIKALKDAGIPVLASIGGQNGHVLLTTLAQKNTFVQGIYKIIDQYGFDGLDLDFEGGSMNFGAGTIPDFSYATISNGKYPKLQYIIDAIKEIKAHYGPGFHISAAPEVYYVQVGYGNYSDIVGSFLAVLDNIRPELDYLHVQLYNTGSVNGLDGKAYSQATPDFIVAMCDMLLKGFNVASTGIHFNALKQEQVAVGLPSCTSAAPAGGYMVPAQVIKALDYLTKGISFGGTYDMGTTFYPNLRGAMTWSVNWDKTPTCGPSYEFSNYMGDYFNGATVTSIDAVKSENTMSFYPMPTQGIIHADGLKENTILQVYNSMGALVASEKTSSTNHVLNLTEQQDGLYFIVRITGTEKAVSKIILQK